MKQTIFKIIFTTLLLTALPALSQDESNQFEKAEAEIVKLINLPNPTFNPNVTQEPMTEAAIADLGFEQTYKMFLRSSL